VNFLENSKTVVGSAAAGTAGTATLTLDTLGYAYASIDVVVAKSSTAGHTAASILNTLTLSQGDTTAAGSTEAVVEISEAMLAGHASLPNGYGVDYITPDGRREVPGVAPNELTSSDWRDAYAGTPWHKHVPARIEALA